MSLSLSLLSYTNTASQYFEIQDVHLQYSTNQGLFLSACNPKKAIFESCVCNHAIAIMVLFIQIKTRTENTLSAWCGACLPFACILISTLCRAVLLHCVWSTLVRAVKQMATAVALLSFWLHLSTPVSVAYNKTRLWKHSWDLTCTD